MRSPIFQAEWRVLSSFVCPKTITFCLPHFKLFLLDKFWVVIILDWYRLIILTNLLSNIYNTDMNLVNVPVQDPENKRGILYGLYLYGGAYGVSWPFLPRSSFSRHGHGMSIN
jgi:hypothetical protein